MSYSDEWPAPEDQPVSSTLSKRTGLVHVSMFRQMEAERDAARTRLLEVEAAHKQTIRHATALGEERDAAVARADQAEAELDKMRRSPGWRP